MIENGKNKHRMIENRENQFGMINLKMGRTKI